jgi:cell division protein FtsB
MNDLVETIFLAVLFVVLVLGAVLLAECHRHNQMERELEGWNNELREERMREAKEVLP